MRKTLIYITFLLLLPLFSACRKEPFESAPSEEHGWTTVHLRATVSGGLETKASLDEYDRDYVFERDDLLYVVNKNSGRELYGFLYLISGEGATTAVFEGDLMYFDPDTKEPGEPDPSFAITATLVSAAQRSSGFFTTVTGNDGKIDSGPNYGNAIAATFKDAVQKYSHFTGNATYGNPSFSLNQQSAFVLFQFSFDDDLQPGDLTFHVNNNGVEVRSTTVTPDAYKRASFVAAFPNGTELTSANVTFTGGGLTKDPRGLTNSTLQANRYYNVNQCYVDLTYFTIQVGPESTDITFNYNTLEYSTDNGSNWTSVSSAPATINFAANAHIKVRGSGSTYDFNSSSNTIFTSTKNCTIYGDIMSLFSNSSSLGEAALRGAFKNLTNIDIPPGRPLRLSATSFTGNNCYEEMFAGCTGLTYAPEFKNATGQSASTINRKVCYNMFSGCTSLKEAPELPANTVGELGYARMFYGCSALATPPVRLAQALNSGTNKDNGAFREMFAGCTSLRYAPELPASSVPAGGYFSMFSSCTSLLAAPELPATSVATYGYYSMFSGCTAMTTGPSELPATAMQNYCYSLMFSGCSSLAEAPEIKATGTLAEGCFNQMFQNCSRLRTAQDDFYFTTIGKNSCKQMFLSCLALNNAPNMPNVSGTVGESGCHDMYNNCGELVTAPLELKASKVGKNGYRGMFLNCLRIKTAPSISATEVGVDGCRQMFSGCTRLQTPPPTLPATTLGATAYCQMFNGCSTLKSAPDFPTTDATISGTQTCYMMFYNCTSITELSGQLFGAGSTLSTECFRQMFQNCTSLKTVPQGFLPATTLAGSCYRGMFENTAIERAPDLLVETLNASLCYQYMFNKCKSLKYVKCLATNAGDNDGNTYTQNWMKDVPNDDTRTFVRKNGAQWASSIHGIPSNWRIEEYPPSTP